MADSSHSSLTLRIVLLTCAAGTLLNILPLLMFPIGGDIMFHYVMIDCFAHQFWQGDLYPRWCMNANAGLGAPLFLFYFPLPYYLTALFYPLEKLGLTVYGIYDMGAGLATFLTALTCYAWLKDIISSRRALLVSILFLFMPYRMECLYFRSAYAEIWAIAFIPLVFKYIRRLARGGRAIVPLTASFTLLFLSHVPESMVVVIMSGLYMLVMSGGARLPKIRYAASLLWAGAISAFYWLPAAYYRRFITPDDMTKSPNIWANHSMGLNNLSGQMRPVLLAGLTIVAVTGLLALAFRHRARITYPFVRREIVAWGVAFLAALLLLLPLSAPLYALLGPVSRVVFPWRMQSVFILCLTFLLALWLQWLGQGRRTWKADYALLLALMVALSYFPLTMRDPSFEPTAQKIIAADQVSMIEYRSIWMDKAHFTMEYTLARYARKTGIARAEITAGQGQLASQRWAWDGIILRTQSVGSMTVRLDHNYFPLWIAKDEADHTFALHPEAGSGQMLLDVPAGNHTVTLSRSMDTAPFIVRWAWLASATALVAMAAMCRRSCRYA